MPQKRVQNAGEAIFKTLAAGVQGVQQGLDQRRESEQKIRTEKLQNFMSVLQFENAQRDQQSANIRNRQTLQLIEKNALNLKELNRWDDLSQEERAAEKDRLAQEEAQRKLDASTLQLGGMLDLATERIGEFPGQQIGAVNTSGFSMRDIPTDTPSKDPFTTQRNAWLGAQQKANTKEVPFTDPVTQLEGTRTVVVPFTASELAQKNREFDEQFGVEGRLPELVEPTKASPVVDSVSGDETKTFEEWEAEEAALNIEAEQDVLSPPKRISRNPASGGIPQLFPLQR